MTITLIGVSHETAGVETRDCLAVSAQELPARLHAAVSCPGVVEALILSTCNRCELYLVTDNGRPPDDPEGLYARVLQVPPELLHGHGYVLRDAAAVAHVFKVASGGASMVLGETEIVGQLRRAVEGARRAETAGRILSRLGDRALSVGKRARTETRIDRGCLSVASVAAALARQIFDDLAARRVLVLGAGEMGSLVARRMIEHGASNLTVISRHLARATALAGAIGGRAVDLRDLTDQLLVADIVIASTSAPQPLVTARRIEAAAGAGRRRPMLLLDLAMPRNIEPQVREINDVYLYDLDDLQQFARQVADRRRGELPAVEQIAEAEAHEFMIWAQSQGVLPLVLSVRQQVEAIREEEVSLLLQAVPELSRKADKALHLMTKRLVRRLLEQPLEKLCELSSEGLSEHDLALMAEVFGAEATPAPSDDEAEEGDDD